MANLKEVKAEVDELCELMRDIKVSDDVKEEVACASLVMQSCFAMAIKMTGKESDQTSIALELFRSVVMRSTMQSQTGAGIEVPGLGRLRIN